MVILYLGQKIVKKLKAVGINYVAIEHERKHVKEGHQKGDIVFFGNAASQTMLNSFIYKRCNRCNYCN